MDTSTFNRAKAAYDAQDWETAAILFSACMEGPGGGEAAHLRGNALMRLGRVQEAIDAYRRALQDASYAHRGAVLTNLGKAQVALGDYRGAVESLRAALQDEGYPGAYKAWLALGGAYSRLGDARSAGVAYRKAALEANNPDPAKALINLGVCFVQMRRPEDAASAYRTALDFSQDLDERDMILSNLGQAYVASNRMVEAVKAFNDAIEDGYQLLPPAQADFEKAKRVAESLAGSVASASGRPAAGSTEDLLSGISTTAIDPLDPTGKSGEIMPSPDESGFFYLTDEQIEAAGKQAAKDEKKSGKAAAKSAKKAAKARGAAPRHTGLKVAIVALVVVILAFVAAMVAYLVFGAGFPSQTTSINEVFSAAEQGSISSDGWAQGISAQTQTESLGDVAQGSTHEIQGLDYEMASSSVSTAYVVVTLPMGGTIAYDVTLGRDGLGWKVTSVVASHSSMTSDTFSSSASDGTATRAASSTSDAVSATATAATATPATATAATGEATAGAAGEETPAAEEAPAAAAAA